MLRKQRGFITVVIDGEGGHRWEYVNVWGTHWVNGTLGPVHFAEPYEPFRDMPFGTKPPAGSLAPHVVEAGQLGPWDEGPEAAGDAPEGAADEGPGAADEGPAGAWADLDPGFCGILDPPSKTEFPGRSLVAGFQVAPPSALTVLTTRSKAQRGRGPREKIQIVLTRQFAPTEA